MRLAVTAFDSRSAISGGKSITESEWLIPLSRTASSRTASLGFGICDRAKQSFGTDCIANMSCDSMHSFAVLHCRTCT